MKKKLFSVRIPFTSTEFSINGWEAISVAIIILALMAWKFWPASTDAAGWPKGYKSRGETNASGQVVLYGPDGDTLPWGTPTAVEVDSSKLFGTTQWAAKHMDSLNGLIGDVPRNIAVDTTDQNTQDAWRPVEEFVAEEAEASTVTSSSLADAFKPAKIARRKKTVQFDPCAWVCPDTIVSLKQAKTVSSALSNLGYLPQGGRECTGPNWQPLVDAIADYQVANSLDSAACWCETAASLQVAYRGNNGCESPEAGELPCNEVSCTNPNQGLYISTDTCSREWATSAGLGDTLRMYNCAGKSTGDFWIQRESIPLASGDNPTDPDEYFIRDGLKGSPTTMADLNWFTRDTATRRVFVEQLFAGSRSRRPSGDRGQGIELHNTVLWKGRDENYWGIKTTVAPEKFIYSRKPKRQGSQEFQLPTVISGELVYRPAEARKGIKFCAGIGAAWGANTGWRFQTSMSASREIPKLRNTVVRADGFARIGLGQKAQQFGEVQITTATPLQKGAFRFTIGGIATLVAHAGYLERDGYSLLGGLQGTVALKNQPTWQLAFQVATGGGAVFAQAGVKLNWSALQKHQRITLADIFAPEGTMSSRL